MAWIEPKIDWKSSDYFNAVDYNRIINNLKHLRDDAEVLFKSLELSSSGNEKGYNSDIYASEINEIENDLETINLNTYNFAIGEKTLYKANGKTILYSEFNRIENAMLKLHAMMQIHKESLPRLAFSLRGSERIVV